MSNAVSALAGREAVGEVTVRDAGLRGMITLRGDLADPKLHAICTGLAGVDFPGAMRANCVGQKGLCWMSPDEILILLPYAEVPKALGMIDAALEGTHYLAQSVSDARAVLSVEGGFCREVIAKLAPVDLHPDAFRPGDFRRTRLGQVAAAFWMRDEACFEIICFRSVAGYAFDLLAASAKAGPVRLF
ncbi:sarcosine oxidase subunit gamma family protein [Yoonia sp. BS5-3]|uniref:Sarcosine oxidase subunit gamma n=1 Tax=Yoonia phaeophyticola TaxID=3137369 RepID=A0ABZ2V2A6_9RHOB